MLDRIEYFSTVAPIIQVPAMMGQVIGLPLRFWARLGGQLAIDFYPGAVSDGKELSFGIEVGVQVSSRSSSMQRYT